eukprot:352523-Chlamydomonas_euryale.AAC.2
MRVDAKRGFLLETSESANETLQQRSPSTVEQTTTDKSLGGVAPYWESFSSCAAAPCGLSHSWPSFGWGMGQDDAVSSIRGRRRLSCACTLDLPGAAWERLLQPLCKQALQTCGSVGMAVHVSYVCLSLCS